MSQYLSLLEVARVNAIMQGLQDIREVPKSLVFVGRTAATPANEDEILARFIGTIQIADLVADDQAAGVYSMGKFQFETTKIPNLKWGIAFTQTMLNQLLRINATGVEAMDSSMFKDYQLRTLDLIRVGILQRMESLIIGMYTDSYNYDRLGIKIVNGTWGMPAELKITPAVAWTDTVNSTPVTDIILAQRTALVRYGEVYDRITLSRAVFNLLTQNTQFINFARTLFAPGITNASLPMFGTAQYRELAQRVLSQESPIELELYDSRFYSESTAGVVTQQPFLPINQVILSNSQNDGNAEVMDWADGIVAESIVGSVVRGLANGDFNGPARGPFAYTTGALNPPNLTHWGVRRGFPRKKRLQATAVLNVGNVADVLPTSIPFPA